MENNQRTILIVGIVLLVLVIMPFGGMMGWGGYNNYGGMYSMMNGFYGGAGFMWMFGWLFMTLGIIALVLLILWLIKQLGYGERNK